MTFIAPSNVRGARAITFFARKGVRPKRRVLIADEDGARVALGADGGTPSVPVAGVSLEHLARIALG